MKAVWKWIIGVVVVLVVVAAIVVGALVLRNQFAAMHGYTYRVYQTGPGANPTPNAPNTPNGQNPYYGRGPYPMGPYMMPYGGRDYPGMPMMRRDGFEFIGPILGLFGFLFFAGIVTLIVLLILALVKRQNSLAVASSVPVPANTHPCKNCGQPVQDGFEYCPHCGAKQ